MFLRTYILCIVSLTDKLSIFTRVVTTVRSLELHDSASSNTGTSLIITYTLTTPTYRCLKTGKQSQVSLYLEEQTTCSYSLTVEGMFVCSLLDHIDSTGVFIANELYSDNTETGKDHSETENKGQL